MEKFAHLEKSDHIDRINKILEETIHTIENSREEILDIVRHARNECIRLEEDLKEIRNLVDKVIKEVDSLYIEEKKSRAYLSMVSKNFDIYSEEDIKNAYEKTNDLRIKLFLKKEEERTLIEKRNEIELMLKSAIDVYKKVESAAKSVSVASEYLKGNMNEILFTIDDLTKRQYLGIKIIEAQEEERQRLARDIHDGPAQSMANIILKTEICERLLDIDKGKTKEELKNLKAIVKETLKDIREIIFDLRPMSLDDLGLIPTLKKYIDDFSLNTGIKTSFNIIGTKTELEPAIEIAIFRIIQESLNNINKHSQATNANVVIEFADERVNLSIIDNGIGFNIEEVEKIHNTKTGGFGLINIRERSELLGGKLQIKTSPGKGTKLNIYIPIIKEEVVHGK
ncbi:two-component system sensor histidine kinase DegS [Keratinibaculum paraultunense]|uniref:Oxygen sensor histidine kinase NreB n=1 Tax=Keratinibaculum paraultunense TaxID=1278232 RepID=A0A4R3KRE8_9FIRM|nr:sensor histidine kinase [Keratinibaculum paraultunense]QQY78782.1 sensor histidine kinase [Keratinibaculum paraultunense]TCS87512.1 two-component system sensor histidine kinase DegS [Keratinibaculum paraultunense]